ncbi:MFS transporter [Rheinheimera sp.]|uniref:MFS transporter n=1 Tax=Rheinheimera sp. TaxID=1869214 RepID=UPI00307F8E1B
MSHIYVRLSAFYFCNCVALGLILPFWGLYMEKQGYSAPEIALVSALLMLTNVIAPPVWGWWADQSGRRLTLIRWGAAAAVLCFAVNLVHSDLHLMVLAFLCCGFFWQGINAQFEALTLTLLAGQSRNYSRIRLWGSVGFVCAVSGGGWLFDQISLDQLPLLVVLSLALMWLSTMLVPQPHAKARHYPDPSPVGPLLRQPAVLLILSAIALIYFSHGTYYGFYSIYLQQHYDNSQIGLLWSLAVAAELLAFAMLPKWLKRYPLHHLLLISVGATCLRWLGLAFGADWLGVLLGCQLLHALSFSAVHACTMEWLHRRFRIQQQGRAQALYYAFCVGAGQAGGTIASGWFWQYSQQAAFLLSALIAAVALLLLMLGQHGLVSDHTDRTCAGPDH